MTDFFENAEGVDYFQIEILEHTAEWRRQNLFEPRAKWLVDNVAATEGNLLDVGCSTGLFLECINRFERFRTFGVEPNKKASEICRAKSLNVAQGTVESFSLNESFDVITAWEMIRHVVDPLHALTKFYNLLNHAGVLVLTTPNIDGLDYFVMGAEHENLRPPMMLNGFTPGSIEQALRNIGYSEIEIGTPGRFDVELVRNFWTRRKGSHREDFLRRLVLKGTETQRGGFQRFLATNGLSSHMRVTARK